MSTLGARGNPAPFHYLVTVLTDTREHADQVMTARLKHDEWYVDASGRAFDYTVPYLSITGRQRGLLVYALESVVKDARRSIEKYARTHGQDYEPPPGKRHVHRELIEAATALLQRLGEIQ